MTEKKVLQITQEIIDRGIESFQETIEEVSQLEESGYYEKKGIEAETVYAGNAMDYAGLGIAYGLNGDIEQAKAAFQTAAEFKVKPLLMAYDENDPAYLGDDIAEGGQAHNVVDCFALSLIHI